jgi:hypothetical protein
VDNSTTAVLWHTNRTLTSTTGSLLLERLLTRTGNFTSAKSRLSSLASSCKLSSYYLVDKWNIGGCVKQSLWQINAARLLTLDVN